jgi:lambda family phage portal protein
MTISEALLSLLSLFAPKPAARADTAADRTRSLDFATGGRRGKGWSTVLSINADVLAARGLGPSRARYASLNQPIVASAVSAFTSNMVGTGIRIVPATGNPELDKILSQRFEDWTDNCDFFGRQSFYAIQSTMARRYFVDGEAIALMVNAGDQLKIKLVDPAQIDTTANSEQADGGIAVAGVVLDTGRPVAYDFYKNFISGLSLLQTLERVRIPAEDVLHHFRIESAGQVRGLSHLSASLLRAHEHDGYSDAQLVRMRTGAMLCGFVVDADATLLQDTPGSGEASLEPGTIQRLKPGESYTQSEATKIGSEVIDHEKGVIREICAGCEVPSFLCDFNMGEINFSSARVALVEFRKKLEAEQDAFAFSILRRVWRRWVATEVLSGRLDAPLTEDTLRFRAIPPKTVYLDPLKDVQGDALAIAAGLMSRKECIAGRGWDIEQVDEEIASDKAREEALGLSFKPTLHSPIGGPDVPPA